MTKYCKKPVVIEAVRYNGENKVEIQEFVGTYLDFTEAVVLGAFYKRESDCLLQRRKG